MAPPDNVNVPAAEFADPVDRMSATNRPIWISDCESLQAELSEANSETIIQGYQQRTKQLNSMLEQQCSTDEKTQNDWVSDLLLGLLEMRIYLKTVVKCSSYQLVGFQPKQWAVQQVEPWEKQAAEVVITVPKETYLNQLNRLVKEAIADENQPIDSTIDSALLIIHNHTLKIHYYTLGRYFQQFLVWLQHNTTQDYLSSDEESSEYKRYTQMVDILHAYITQLPTSPLKEKETEYLSKVLLRQLAQLIETTSTLDLSLSWTKRLKQWIEWCFSKLQLCHKPTLSDELLAISEQLRKATKKVVQNEKLQSPKSLELIRERCWLYFSLHEQFISKWGDKEAHAREYKSTALALFDSFMSTFNWPSTFEKGISHENPLTSYRSAKNTADWLTRFKEGALHWNPLKLYRTANQATPVENWEPLLDTTLNKLSVDFFIRDWWGYDNKRSFLRWLFSRQELRLIAKIKAYIRTEELEFQKDEILPFDKRKLCGFVQETHEDFCADLNQITQMILSVWFQKIGFIVPHKDLNNILLKPGRWLYRESQPTRSSEIEADIPFFAFLMRKATERLGGAGLYFFPPFQQRWFKFQEALTAHSGNAAEFAHQKNKEIATILGKLLIIFHTDRKPEADRDNARLKDWAQHYIERIQSVKDDLRKFRERDPRKLQTLDAITEAQALLDGLKDVVLDCMHCHLKSEQSTLRFLFLSPDELQERSQESRQNIIKFQQINADTAKAREAKKAVRIRKQALEVRKQALEARKQERIEAEEWVVVEREQQALPRLTVVESPAALFHAPTTSRALVIATDMSSPLLPYHLLR